MPGALRGVPPVITIDVEDWPQSSWDRSLPITKRAADNIRRLLELLARVEVRATMFVLGKFAERFPDVVREIDAAGHEIGSHGYGHVEIFKQSLGEFSADLKRSKQFLEQTIGKPVNGYRAPDFSIVPDSLWALEEIAEQGFEYDSSIFPVSRPRYGIPDWPLGPTRVMLPGGRSLLEFPIASYRALGRNWPVGGGGYYRLLPGPMSRWFVRRVAQSRPFVFYCHPYEFDPREFAEISLKIPLKVRLHQGLGRGRFENRFVRLVQQFGGRRVVDVVSGHTWPEFRLDRLALASANGRNLASRTS
jgi:polysaccharide deacetylase family protein (PEP-CTERM system associated)